MDTTNFLDELSENNKENIELLNNAFKNSNLEPLAGTSQNQQSCVQKTKITNFFKPKLSPKTLPNNENDKKRGRIHSDEDLKGCTKKIMRENVETVKKEVKIDGLIKNIPESKNNRCNICHQKLLDKNLKIYNGHPNNAVDEIVALINPSLMLFSGEETDLNEMDHRPVNKVTGFSVYDKAGHLCYFDTGLIEANKLLYFSGYIKPVYDENQSIEGGIPTKDMGPINEWFISGFDGGENALLGFSTEFSEYFLVEPSEEYAPFMCAVKEKTFVTKIVIEFLLSESWRNPTYEDLLNYIQYTIPPTFMGSLTEEHLLRYAQFVCDQITNYEIDEENLMITTPCVRALIKLAGVTFGERKIIRNKERNSKKKTTNKWRKATTTTLVQHVFESLFPEQLEEKGAMIRRKRCGVCEACQQPDCGKCSKCRNMAKFGGSGKSKQACVLRRCPNMAIQEAEDSDGEQELEEYDIDDGGKNKSQVMKPSDNVVNEHAVWDSDVIANVKDRHYYSRAKIGNFVVKHGDYVLVKSRVPTQPMVIMKIVYMFENPKGRWFHAEFLCRGTDTVLGECALQRELFVIDQCSNLPLGAVVRKAKVEHRIPDSKSFYSGKNAEYHPELEDDGVNYFYQFRYDSVHGRFEDLVKYEEETGYNKCRSCKKKLENSLEKVPKIQDEKVHWMKDVFEVGSGVYLQPETFKFQFPMQEVAKINKQDLDEEIYPEYYRKTSDSSKGSNSETSEPFCIGYVVEIKPVAIKEELNEADNIKLVVQKLYRPENTHKSKTLSQQLDLNLLYWSNEQININISQVTGKCFITNSDNIQIPASDWSKNGPNRFYFNETYDPKTKTYLEVSGIGLTVGRCKGKEGKLKSKVKSKTTVSVSEWPEIKNKLNIFDVFAGCGGLSEGLHQSGVGVTKWAVEQDKAAAKAFKINNPETLVYSEDCNTLLSLALSGADQSEKGLKLPPREQVDILCGGPPCQGFSGMNRFNAGQYSLFKNSLIVSFLSFCDYYRPKYFILENVRNFVSFKRSMVLKLTLRCLLAMGYQCTFGVLQAGNYGIPQTRRRVFIMASAPGIILPQYPEPTHVFNKKGLQLSVVVDDFKFTTGVKWTESAPYRTITVRDAMSDLPAIRNGCCKEETQYDSDPLSHFQRLVRSPNEQILRDHICKEMAPLVEARISNIPTATGSDWRDLPNIVIRLTDGKYTNKLLYEHKDKKNGKNSRGALRGVCPCANGKPCDPLDRQINTLIPWCLPHTANRQNNWAGLYGRLEWDGYFNTTVTNPEPMGKQGRVLHPFQNRVVSVRECARSQGFPDKYHFYGNILDKHRQVGNAVPPPLGAAIGREIKKSWLYTTKNQENKIDEIKEGNLNAFLDIEEIKK